MDDERTSDRRELMAPYERPVRHAAAATWRDQLELRRATVGTVALGVAGGIGALAGVELLGALMGLATTVIAVLIVLWAVALVRATGRLMRSRRPTTELAAVRANRPQAGTEDPEVAHAEFAVTVEENGRLVTWAFRPLAVWEEPDGLELEVPGRPRYAASPVEDTTFDAEDTVHASEQLIAAQAEAARREVLAAAEAHARLDHARTELTRAGEARTTAAALQRVTGQQRRHD